MSFHWKKFFSFFTFTADEFAEKNFLGSSDKLPITGFVDSEGKGWTTYLEEAVFLEEIADLSDLPEYSEKIRQAKDSQWTWYGLLIVDSQHGNKPAGREMSLLQETSVLIIPTATLMVGRVSGIKGFTWI